MKKPVRIVQCFRAPPHSNSSCPVYPLHKSPDPLDATTSEPEPPRNSNTANRRRLRVLAQCKAEKRKMGPAYLRELEGVAYRHATLAAATTPALDASLLLRRRLPPPRDLNTTSDPPPPRPTTTAPASVLTSPATTPTTTTTTTKPPTAMQHPPVVAILISESEFTRNCLFAANASPLPFLLVHLPATSSSSKRSSSGAGSAAIGAVFGNPALVSARGVLGGDLEIRWERGTGAGAGAPSGGALDAGSGGARGGGGGGRPGLWWQGQPLPSWTPDAEAADGALLEQR